LQWMCHRAVTDGDGKTAAMMAWHAFQKIRSFTYLGSQAIVLDTLASVYDDLEPDIVRKNFGAGLILRHMRSMLKSENQLLNYEEGKSCLELLRKVLSPNNPELRLNDGEKTNFLKPFLEAAHRLPTQPIPGCSPHLRQDPLLRDLLLLTKELLDNVAISNGDNVFLNKIDPLVRHLNENNKHRQTVETRHIGKMLNELVEQLKNSVQLESDTKQ